MVVLNARWADQQMSERKAFALFDEMQSAPASPSSKYPPDSGGGSARLYI